MILQISDFNFGPQDSRPTGDQSEGMNRWYGGKKGGDDKLEEVVVVEVGMLDYVNWKEKKMLTEQRAYD